MAAESAYMNVIQSHPGITPIVVSCKHGDQLVVLPLLILQLLLKQDGLSNRYNDQHKQQHQRVALYYDRFNNVQ